MYKIGIDIGGSHIGASVINNKSDIIGKKEIRILKKDKENIKQFIVENIINLINELLLNLNLKIGDIEKIGIAFPGIIKDEIIYKAKNLGVDDFNLIKELKKDLDKEIYIKNDTECAALAENINIDYKKYKSVLFMTIGTGIGGAITVEGKTTKIELGHMTIRKDGKKCNCGSKGCFECYSSIKCLKDIVRKELNNKNLSGEEIREILEKNKSMRLDKILDMYIENLSIGLANIINLLKPEVIIIGGGFTYYEKIILPRLKEKINNSKYVFDKNDIPEIKIAKFKNDAGMIGSVL